MPMSPRLLRPRASSGNVATDTAARAYIEAVRIADGGQYMEPAVQQAIDAFIIGLKADSNFTPLKACCILMGARTLAGALTPLVGTAPTNNGPFVSGDYNRETGLVGNGSSKYLDSNRNNNADPQNSYHQAVYVTTAPSAADSAYIGAGGGDTGASQFSFTASGASVVWRNRSATSASESSVGTSTGLLGTTRNDSSGYTSRVAGANTSRTQASQTPFSGSVLVFARNSNTNVAGLFSNARMAFYSIGESVNLATLDTRVSALYAAIGAAIP
jgi:hypothetical protein